MLSRVPVAALALLCTLLLAAGCAVDPEPAPDGDREVLTPALLHAHAGDEDVLIAVLDTVADQHVLLDSPDPFERVGIMMLSTSVPSMDAVVTFADGRSERMQVEVTYSQGIAHVGRLLLDHPATAVRLTPAEPLTDLFVELGGPFRGDRTRLARDLPYEDASMVPKGGTVTPPDFVITRQSWGARYPDRICGEAHSPDRMTVHHTAGANNDNLTAQQTLQQIQSFHIDVREWCDIGYHFLIGRDGNVYQGRTWPDRTGAHVGGQNVDNVGVGFLGNFVDYVPPERMLDAGALILGWISTTWSIPLDRERVRGHGERAATLCPGAQLLSRLESVLEEAGGEPVPPPTTATLIGFVRENAIDNSDGNIAGVTVAIDGGPSTTTGNNGLYRFDGLDLGSVSATFSRNCFAPATSTRDLDSPGEQHWMSVPIVRLQDGDEGPIDCGDPLCTHLSACADAPAPTEPAVPDPTEPPPTSPPTEPGGEEPGATDSGSQPGTGSDPGTDSPGEGSAPSPTAPGEDSRQPPQRPPGSGASASGEYKEFTSQAGCNAAPGGGTQGCAIPWMLLLLALFVMRPRREEASGSIA